MAMAALAGLAAALLILCAPVGLIETVVASSGISEAVPAAAPPLGLTARLMLAGFAGLMAVGVVGLIRRDPGVPALADESTPDDASAPDAEPTTEYESAPGNGPILADENGRDHRVQGADEMGFAFSKLTALARGRIAPDIDPDAPVLRRADAHPDAPSRPPIFASRDFDGIDIFPRAESGRRGLVSSRASERDTVVPLGNLAMPSAPAPLTEEELFQPAFLRPAGPFAVPTLVETPEVDDAAEAPAAQAAPVEQPAPVIAPVAASDFAEPAHFAEPVRPAPLPLRSTHGLSITELTERLERGLALRTRAATPPVTADSAAADGVIADMPVAPAVPVRATVEQDADEALRAALGALRAMAGRH